jgi:Flp pilus assembly protein TadG
MIRTVLHHIRRDQRGVTAVEFALVVPVLLMMVFGIFDIGHNMYTASMLQGAIQQAARKATIEGSDEAALDAVVTQAVHSVSPYATLEFDRTAYTSFSDVSRPEDFTDLDSDGVCNNGEAFEDANANGTWDTDRGVAGQGGARDAVLYSVTITYRRLFPVAQFIPGQTADLTLKAQTVLRNQPFGMQDTSAPLLGNCA